MNGAIISVRSTGPFMTASVNGKGSALRGSKGILGEYGTGNMVGRDGSIVSEFNEFGFEWQMNPLADPQIFSHARAPQLPYERCRMPTTGVLSRRKLRAQDRKLLAQATEQCATNHPKNVDSCIDDVMMTGEIDLAEAW